MKNKLYNNKTILIPLAAFLIPIVIMTAISIVSGFYPYGKTSILLADMRYQFVDYYGYMKNIFFGNDDFFYSFSKTFGGDMAGLLAYYCNNPFLLFLLFVPNDLLPAGILIMMTIMLGFIGLSFNVFISEVYGKRYATLIFSTAYAFIGYLMGYFNCTLYYFSVMLLPMVMLGLYRIVKNEKISVLYILSMTITIFSSYYIGYMICLFSILFFVYLYLTMYGSEIKNHLKTVYIYVGTSIVGVGMSTFSLLSAVFSLRGQKSSGLLLTLSRTFNISEFISGLYTAAFHGNVSDGLPLIYSGAIATVFLFFFYINKKVTKSEKIYSILIFIVLVIGYWLDAFNVMWHGFSHPIGFPYRNSFLFSFFLLFLSYKGFLLIKEEASKKYVVIFFILYLLYSAYLLFIKSEYVYPKQVVVETLLLIVIISSIFIYKNVKLRKYVLPVLFVIGIFDAFYNGYVSVNSYFPDKENDTTITMDTYKQYVDETNAIVGEIEANDSALFRMEKLYRRSNNDPMMFGYNGLSHFSSCETDNAKSFIGSLGYRNNENWAYYGEGSTAFADCFMGVKYIISQYDEIAKPYENLYTHNEKTIFKNPYAMPLLFATTGEVKNLTQEGFDLFEYQNQIAKVFSDKINNEIYRKISNVDISLENISENGNTYTKIDNQKEAYIEYSFINTSNDYIYMHFDAPRVQKTKIIVNDLEKQPYFTDYGWSIREMGYYNLSEKVNLRIYLEQDSIEIDDYDFYYENIEALNEWYKIAKESAGTLEKVTSSHLIGNITTSDDIKQLVITVPYEEEWKITIDGKVVKQENVLNGLLSVPVNSGKHIIEMKYIPKGIVYGIPVSILFLLIFLCIVLRKEKLLIFKSRDNI